MLQRDLAAGLMARFHCAPQAVPSRLDICGVEQEVGGGRRAEFEVEGSVGPNGDTRGNGNTGVNVCGASIELLQQTL